MLGANLMILGYHNKHEWWYSHVRCLLIIHTDHWCNLDAYSVHKHTISTASKHTSNSFNSYGWYSWYRASPCMLHCTYGICHSCLQQYPDTNSTHHPHLHCRSRTCCCCQWHCQSCSGQAPQRQPNHMQCTTLTAPLHAW